MKTKITKVAIRVGGTTWTLPAPARHHELIASVIKSTKGVGYDAKKAVQGFKTSDGQFVDRKQAAAIAIKTGQIKELKWPPNLYSEDLW